MPTEDTTPYGDAAVVTAIGSAIRQARKRRGMTMVALAQAAGFSQPFLSQIESGRTSPSLVSLYSIAQVLEIPPSVLMPKIAPGLDEVTLVRARDGVRVRVVDGERSAYGRIVSAHEAQRLIVSEYVVPPGEDLGGQFVSPGDLTVYLISGRIRVQIDGQGAYELSAGDAISYPGRLPNTWTVLGDEPARLILSYAPDAGVSASDAR